MLVEIVASNIVAGKEWQDKDYCEYYIDKHWKGWERDVKDLYHLGKGSKMKKKTKWIFHLSWDGRGGALTGYFLHKKHWL